MPAILVIAGLVVLFLVVKSGNAGGAAGSHSGGASNTGMPDPGTNQANMVGSISAHLGPNQAITPYAGTSKLSPGTSLVRMGGANRTALKSVGRLPTTLRVPLSPSVTTTNPAVVPFSAVATGAFKAAQPKAIGTVPTVVGGFTGRKL